MDGESVSEVLVESASQVYQYISDMQYMTDPPLGVSMTEVSSCDVGDGFAVLHIDGQMPDANGLMLMVGDRILQESEAGFDRYDEVSRTVVVRPGSEVLALMRDESHRVCLLTDMKFLISVVGDFYRRYGSLLTPPELDVVGTAPVYPESGEPTDEQRDAVNSILTNRMSYVWGAPGTGKTQYVLATCIRAVVEAGGRVAVFAPTNNSVEQVLRGIIKAFDGDSRLTGSILRLGVPTRAFYSEHPEMCEDRQAQRRLDACHRKAECLEEVMYERACDCLEGEILDAIRIAREASAVSGKVLLEDVPELREAVDGLRGFLSMRPDTRDRMGDFDDRDALEVLSEIRSMIYDRQRPAVEIEEYSSWSDADLLAAIFETEREIEEMRTGGVSRKLAPRIQGGRSPRAVRGPHLPGRGRILRSDAGGITVHERCPRHVPGGPYAASAGLSTRRRGPQVGRTARWQTPLRVPVVAVGHILRAAAVQGAGFPRLLVRIRSRSRVLRDGQRRPDAVPSFRNEPRQGS